MDRILTIEIEESLYSISEWCVHYVNASVVVVVFGCAGGDTGARVRGEEAALRDDAGLACATGATVRREARVQLAAAHRAANPRRALPVCPSRSLLTPHTRSPTHTHTLACYRVTLQSSTFNHSLFIENCFAFFYLTYMYFFLSRSIFIKIHPHTCIFFYFYFLNSSGLQSLLFLFFASLSMFENQIFFLVFFS